MNAFDKLVSAGDFAERAATLRTLGKKIVFTNGCFDLLHAGHVRYLAAARAAGDVLAVGLNSDVSVRKIKDEGRPINHQDHRTEVLAGLASVDYIIRFDEPDPLRLIRAVKPDILVKGADWAEADIIGAEEVKSFGGRVIRIPLTPDVSTTGIIEKIVKTYGSVK